MISNITPEDRAYWQKKMADHAERQKPHSVIVRLICIVVVVGIVIGFLTARYGPNPEQRDVETILNDTLQMNAGDLSRDSVLDSMRQSPVGREYDSLVKGRAGPSPHRQKECCDVAPVVFGPDPGGYHIDRIDSLGFFKN